MKLRTQVFQGRTPSQLQGIRLQQDLLGDFVLTVKVLGGFKAVFAHSQIVVVGLLRFDYAHFEDLKDEPCEWHGAGRNIQLSGYFVRRRFWKR